MQVGEGRIGRVFVIRLENGDVVPDCLERFAAEKGVIQGSLILTGGIGGGQIVVGPRKTEEMPPEPMLLPVEGAHEVVVPRDARRAGDVPAVGIECQARRQ